MKKITLSDIAKKTGYSVNTVSHALRDMKDISKEVKAYINDTAKKMGYIPNLSAGVLRGGKTMSIAIIVDDITSLDTANAVKEIEVMLRRRGYSIFLMNTQGSKSLCESAVTSALSRNADGIIVLGSLLPKKSIELINENNTPLLFAGAEQKGGVSVTVNQYECGYMAGEKLSELGHKKILFIGDNQKSLSGIQDASMDFSIYTELSENKECSVIVCGNYDIAFKVYMLQIKNGLAIPNDISVISLERKWNDSPLPVDVTCIGEDGSIFCAEVVSILLSMINGEDISSEVTVSPKFFEGETVSEPSAKFKANSRKQLSDYLL